MIVDPDFLDHWRTRMVVDALGGDEMAPMYIMRLWAHCQSRKSDRHAMPPAGLKAQCRAPHDAAAFEQALTDAGFVQREGGTVLVLGWAEQNASLLAAWENGSKGGRPRKEPSENPRVPDQKPTGNPAETHGEPNANPDETDKRRVEKSREEKNSPSLRSGEVSASALGVPDSLLADWLPVRKAKKVGPLTETAAEMLRREADKAGISVGDAIRACCLYGWGGFNAGWYSERQKQGRTAAPVNRQEALEARNREVARRWVAKQQGTDHETV